MHRQLVGLGEDFENSEREYGYWVEYLLCAEHITVSWQSELIVSRVSQQHRSKLLVLHATCRMPHYDRSIRTQVELEVRPLTVQQITAINFKRSAY